MAETMSEIALFIAGFKTVDPKTLSANDWLEVLQLAEKGLRSHPLYGLKPLHALLESKSECVDDKPCHRVHPAVARQVINGPCHNDTKFFELARLTPLPSMQSKSHMRATSKHVLVSVMGGSKLHWSLRAEWIPNWEEFHITGQERLQLTHYRLNYDSPLLLMSDRQLLELLAQDNTRLLGLQMLQNIYNLQEITTDKRRELLELDECSLAHLGGFLKRFGQR